MPWNQEIFLKNIQYLVDFHCEGNKKEFGRRIGDRDAVLKWTGGKNKPPQKPARDILIRIEDKFHGGLDWLIYGNESKQCRLCGNMDEPTKEACRTFNEMLKSKDKSVQMLGDSILRSIGSYRESKKRRSGASLVSKKRGRTEKRVM